MALHGISNFMDGMPLALTGATAAARFVGGTTSGAPASGTFSLGDFSVDQTGSIYICTAAGSPGTWTQVGGSAGATVATTISGLGTASGGKIGLIRAGSSPFDFLTVVYDATYSHWVSQIFPMTNALINGGTTSNTGYTGLSGSIENRVWVPWKTYSTAGLTLQMRLIGQISATSGNTTSAALQLFSNNVGSTAAANGTQTSVITTTSTSAVLGDSGWVNADAGATVHDVASVDIQIKVSAGTAAGISSPSVYARYIG